MSIENFREPLEKDFTFNNGTVRKFILSKFPATAGREIVTQYTVTAAPKVGDYKANEVLMLRLMSYVAVVLDDGTKLQLTTQGLIDNHVLDFETLMRIEWAMMEYNCSFFAKEKLSGFLAALGTHFQGLITQTLMPFLQQSTAKDTPQKKS